MQSECQIRPQRVNSRQGPDSIGIKVAGCKSAKAPREEDYTQPLTERLVHAPHSDRSDGYLMSGGFVGSPALGPVESVRSFELCVPLAE
jgi:hypothetical protein